MSTASPWQPGQPVRHPRYGAGVVVNVVSGSVHCTFGKFGERSFPLIIQNVLQSAALLADAAESFAANMVEKLEPNRAMIEKHLANSLMLVTALNPRIGYDKAVAIAKKALAEHITLKESAAALGYVRPEDFDAWVRPEDMLQPGASLAGG